MYKVLSISIAVMLLAGTAALADDSNSPIWRGEWSTTTQWWEFMTDEQGGDYHYEAGTGVAPDGPGPLVAGQPGDPYPPGYLPSTELWIDPIDPWIEMDSESGRIGIWPLSGIIDVIVDNHEPPNEYKWVWLQLTWRDQDPQNPNDPMQLLSNFDAHGPDEPYAHDSVVILQDLDVGFGWRHTTYEWFIYPNPVDEIFTIGGTIDVDELVIDTWCIPEPATLGLLLVSGLLALRRRQ